MRDVRRWRGMAVLALVALTMCTTPAAAQKGKKPGGGGGGGGTPLPNVRYALSTFPLPSEPRMLNNAGMVVGEDRDPTGRSSPYLRIVDPVDGTDHFFTGDRLDLVAALHGWPLPPGYRFRAANAVNEAGLVVGVIVSEDGSEHMGFALDTGLSPDPAGWAFSTLPTMGALRSQAQQVNDWGDILVYYVAPEDGTRSYLYNYHAPADNEPLDIGVSRPSVYGLNNSRQVLIRLYDPSTDSRTPAIFEEGRPLRVFAETYYYPPHDYNHLNDAGVFSWMVANPKGAGLRPMRRGIDSPTNELLVPDNAAWPHGINQNSDVIMTCVNANDSTTSYFYHNEAGLFPIADLIPDTDPLKASWVRNRGTVRLLADRSSNPLDPDHLRFPVILGTTEAADGTIRGMLLSPVPAQP